MQMSFLPKKKIHFGEVNPAINPLLDKAISNQEQPAIQSSLPQQQGYQQTNNIVPFNFQIPQQGQMQTPISQQNNQQQQTYQQQPLRYDAPGQSGQQNQSNNIILQVGKPLQNQIQNNVNWIKPLKNTDIEERELRFQAKNKLAASKFFKGYVEACKKYSNQSCIMDIPQQILQTKDFFLKQQPLAIKVQQFMEQHLFYQQNQMQSSFSSFIQKNNIKNSQVNLTQQVIIQLKNLDQNPKSIELKQQYSNSKEDITFLKNIETLATFLRDSKTLDLLTKCSTYEQLSPLSKFIYRYFILNLPCRILVENLDYYLFQSYGGFLDENILIQLVLYNLKHEEKLSEMIKQSEMYQPIDSKKFEFQKFESFILQFQAKKSLILKVQLFFGDPPRITPKLSEKYSQLWDLYEKGCKIQIFKKILEADWPEKSFQQGFEATFSMIGQFQLFIIWLKQMQEKIMDFQFFARACILTENIQNSKEQMAGNIPSYFQIFKTELHNLIFRQIANQLYCVASTLTNKDLEKQTEQVFQIFFSKDEKSQLLLGNVVCQKNNSSLCFYFSDHKDNHQLKKVSIVFVSGRVNISAQAICDADFNVDSKVDKYFEYRIFDTKDTNKKYSDFSKFYDTVLINKIIQKTRSPGNPRQDIDLTELLFPK